MCQDGIPDLSVLPHILTSIITRDFPEEKRDACISMKFSEKTDFVFL